MGRVETEAHPMRRAVAGDTRCADCGMTRGAKAHRAVTAPAVDVTGASDVPAVAPVEITESAGEIDALYASWETRELVRDAAGLATSAVKAHASGHKNAELFAQEGTRRAVAAYMRPDAPAGCVPAPFRDLVASVINRAPAPAVDQVDTVPAGEPAATAPAVDPVTPESDTVPASVPAVPEGSRMRLTMSRVALFNALSLVNVAVPSRPSVPILSGVLVTATAGGVTFRGTDWDTYATADVDADVSLPGTVAVSARALTEWEKTLPKSVHTVALTLVDGCTLRVAGADARGTGYREIPTMPAEDFPADSEAVSSLGTVDLVDLVAGIKATAPAASTDETLPNMCAVSLVAENRTLRMDATDRYRLASVDLTWSPAGAGNDWGALPNVKTLVSAVKALVKIAGRKAPGTVTMGARYAGLENAFLGMTYAGADGAYYVLKIRSRDVDAFPRLRGLYPDKAVTTVTVDGAHLVDLVKRVSDMKAFIPVVLTFDGQTVTAEFGESERIPGEPAAREIGDLVDQVTGPAVTIGFRPAFLVAGIESAGGGHVTFTLVDGFKPAVITPVDGAKQGHTLPAGTVRHLIMPIRTTVNRVVKPAVTAPATAIEPHAYVSFGGTSARRCGLDGCDRGKTAAIHRVPAGEPAATAPAGDQVDTVTTDVHMPAVDDVPAVTVRLTVPASMTAPAGDQVDTVPAGEPAATAPAPAGDQVDQGETVSADVRALIAAGVWQLEHVSIGRPSRRANRVMQYVMRLPDTAGRLPRDTYVTLAAQLKSLGSHGWNRNAKGFTFDTGDSGNPWRAATPSGRERVSAWLAATAPAGDQVDQVATVPAPADVVDTVPAGEPAATAPTVAVFNGVTADLPAFPMPADFLPYADEIRGCRDRFCRAVAGAVRAGEPVNGPARLLLAALRTGYHLRVSDVPAVDQVDDVPAGAGYPYRAVWDRPASGPLVVPMSAVGRRVAYRRDDVTVIGPVNFEPGMVRVRMADSSVVRAMVCDIKRVDQVDDVPAPRALVDASALNLVTGIVPDTMPAPILPAGMLEAMPAITTPADFKPYREEFALCECTVCRELAYNSHHYSDTHARRRAARVLLAHLVAGTHQRVTIAEVAAFARTAKAARLDAARTAGASAETLATIERGYSKVTMGDFFATGMGLGIGPRAVVDQDTAPAVDQVATVPAVESDVTAPAPADVVDTVPAVDQVDTVDMGPDTVDQGGNTVHVFDSTGQAYDRVNCDDSVKSGDILHVPSERVIGVATSAWPTAVTAESGELHGAGGIPEWTSEGYGDAIDQARALAESLGYALAGDTVPVVAESAPAACAVTTLAGDQVDTVPAPSPAPREVPVRVVFDASPVVPALAESAPAVDQVETYGAHPQRVHVSNIGDGDGYRFHLVAGANGRALAKVVKPELARMRRELGAAFYVTAPRKSGAINVVPQPGHTVADWAPVLAVFARLIGDSIAPAGECGACDRSAALVDA